MDRTITVGQKCLVNELVFSLWALKKSAKAQYNLMILSKVIVVTDDDNENDNRQTDNLSSDRTFEVSIPETLQFSTSLILRRSLFCRGLLF